MIKNMVVSAYSNEQTDSDAVIASVSLKKMPILTLTDEFIKRTKVTSETETDTNNSINSLYVKDSTGDNVDMKELFRVTSKNRCVTIFYYNPISRVVFSLPSINDIDSDNFKNRQIGIDFITYGVSNHINNNTGSNIFATNEGTATRLPEPNIVNNITKYTLALKGLVSNPGIERVKHSDGLYEHVSVVEVIELSLDDLGLSSSDLQFYTIHAISSNRDVLTYIGNATVDKIYIPIL